ncbi:unnamed protein product [Adineta steineri]|uniref:protein-tyrosine-phosphatase n=1 Tax=Adineta steineri TaxID=433720 RepID=A0A818YRG0_9BILA|nr:unnamed protein product [Adineta steineri]CAF3753571.1 unnamed protein product [Adineta steineri]
MTSNWEAPSQILPHLFLGSYSCTHNKEELIKIGIKYILNLTDSPNLHPNSFIYLQCPVKDSSSEDILPLFEQVFNFIDQASLNSACLIHCHMGVSRSPSFVLVYLIHKKERNLRESYELLIKARKHISPNFGFLQQLMAFEDSLFGNISIYFDQDNSFD